jgi:hypothetical protein
MSERGELKRAGLKAHKNSGRGAVKQMDQMMNLLLM